MYKLLGYLPKNHLSFVLGTLAGIRLPSPLSSLLLRWFVSRYQIDIDEASEPLEAYGSIAELFIRELKPELRPVGKGVCSPVDGRLRNFGIVQEGQALQVKDKYYSIAELLGSSEQAQAFEGGLFFHFYLSPQDYHHVHAPLAGEIAEASYIPGMLWPVNDWSLHNVRSLYSVNERVVSYIQSDIGRVALVMVGATNVGKIDAVFDSFPCEGVRRLAASRSTDHRRYSPAFEIAKGAKLGTFHLGSSVVLLLPREAAQITPATEKLLPFKVKFGQSLELDLLSRQGGS